MQSRTRWLVYPEMVDPAFACIDAGCFLCQSSISPASLSGSTTAQCKVLHVPHGQFILVGHFHFFNVITHDIDECHVLFGERGGLHGHIVGIFTVFW